MGLIDGLLGRGSSTPDPFTELEDGHTIDGQSTAGPVDDTVEIPRLRLKLRGPRPGPEELGERDGRVGLPLPITSNAAALPPGIHLIRSCRNYELDATRALCGQRRQVVVRDIALTEKRCETLKHTYLESLAAYEAVTGSHLLSPRYRDLEIAEKDDDIQKAGAVDPTHTWASIIRLWHPRPHWFWLATGVLTLAEAPLAYGLSASLFVDAASEFEGSALRAIFTVSLCVTLLVAVKVAGILFRRATAFWELRTLGGTSNATADRATQLQLRRMTHLNFGLGAFLSLLLVLLTAALANYRSEVIRSLVSAGRDLGLANVLTKLDRSELMAIFLLILFTSLTAGIVLAWLSTDPTKDAHHKANRERGADLVASRAAWRAAETRLAQLQKIWPLLDQDDGNLIAFVHSWAARMEERYWTANQAARRDIISEAYLRWQHDRCEEARVPDINLRHLSSDGPSGDGNPSGNPAGPEPQAGRMPNPDAGPPPGSSHEDGPS